MRIIVLLALLCHGSLVDSHDDTLNLAHKLRDWLVVQNGGEFNTKQEIRGNGTFASKTIAKGEILARIPWSIIIDNDDKEDEEEELYSPNHSCSTFQNLFEELKLGPKSKYQPYMDYLLERNKKLPVVQSYHGKYLLEQILGIPEYLNQSSYKQQIQLPLMKEVVPPFLDHEWRTECIDEEDDEILWTAAQLLAKFSHNKLLIPVYDFYAHRNGNKFLNTKIEAIYGEYYQIVASRSIQSGEQIYGSYNDCEDCNVPVDYGTAEIFRDYGIVESMPQRWDIPVDAIYIPFDDEEKDLEEIKFPSTTYKLEIEIQEDVDGKLYWEFSEPDISFDLHEDGTVTWASNTFHELKEAGDFDVIEGRFRKQLRRLKRIRNIEWDRDAQFYSIPQEEWDAIWLFHKAYTNALELALEAIGVDLNTGDSHYDDFRYEMDGTVYNNLNCKSSELIDFRDYEIFEEKQSNYQGMTWQSRAQDSDTCLHLDDMLQICSSYRPHYHEFFVHYPAQFLNSVKRVIFLGSGDAMLLHEILKYKDLELVVGLELDQDITRTSFKHFKTQAHFDDERVEWWYGDATKTLPLLPKDYWGSFDLVLVDLSETVVSMDVTGQHDVLEVLAMLLKPEGILLENELYLDSLMDHFDYTQQIFYGSPKVCTQALTLSSNKIDFMHHPMKDHKIHTYLVKPPETERERFKYTHDYIKSKSKCVTADGDKDNVNSVVYGKPAGILEILNLEQTSVLDTALEQKLASVIKGLGLKVLNVPVPTMTNVAAVVMEEGYIVARKWSALKYCAIDLYLWGGFSKRNDLRRALIDALQSALVSNYRIVVGGMYGSKSEEIDKQEIGVNFSQNRNCERPTPSVSTINADATKIMVEEIIRVLPTVDVAVVVCGLESKEECLTYDTLLQSSHVTQVFPIWTCPEITSIEIGDEQLYACETKLERALYKIIETTSTFFDALIFDDVVGLPMIQIFDSLLTSNRKSWFERKYILVSPYDNQKAYKGRFLSERYRKHTHGTAVSAGTLVVQAAEEAIAFVVLIAGDEYAFYQLREMEQRLKGQLGTSLNLELRACIGGGEWMTGGGEYETYTFGPDMYDSNPAIQQNEEQQSLGRQTVFQMHWNRKDEKATFQKLLHTLESTLERQGYKADRFDIFKNVGDGGVAITAFKEGNAILVWDGRATVTVNLFLYKEEKRWADLFLETLERLSGHTLKLTLRDDQPRGTGRVMNFANEMDNKSCSTLDQ